MAKFVNILGTVGNTPVVRINRLAPEGVKAATLEVSCPKAGRIVKEIALP